MEVDPGVVAAVALFTFLLNIPFGYWRAYAKRNSLRLEWFAAIHLPVPLIYLARRIAGVPVILIPVFVVAFFLGQYLGSRVYNYVYRCKSTATRCMVCDIVNLECTQDSYKNYETGGS
ncbi:MAG: hypothetical protein GSR85_11325 [Desulfurococcales archaeon]|nr:hypothetical protein [Desulfurococcales archaeon]